MFGIMCPLFVMVTVLFHAGLNTYFRRSLHLGVISSMHQCHDSSLINFICKMKTQSLTVHASAAIALQVNLWPPINVFVSNYCDMNRCVQSHGRIHFEPAVLYGYNRLGPMPQATTVAE